MNYEDMSDFDINKAVAVITGQVGKIGLVKVSNGKITDSSLVVKDYCNNPSDAWPLLLKLTESGCTIVIEKESVNGKLLNGKSITRKIAELYLSFNSD